MKKSSGGKVLFKGEFNWHGEVYKLYRYARSKRQAFGLFISIIASVLHLTRYKVRNYFLGGGYWEVYED